MDINTIEYTIQDHLRSPEQLKYILPAQDVKNGPEADKISSKSNSRRLLAIITNVDYDEEEGRYGARSTASTNCAYCWTLAIQYLRISIER